MSVTPYLTLWILIQSFITIRWAQPVIVLDTLFFISLLYFLFPVDNTDSQEKIPIGKITLSLLSLLLSVLLVVTKSAPPLNILGYFLVQQLVLRQKDSTGTEDVTISYFLFVSLLIPSQTEQSLFLFINFVANTALFILRPVLNMSASASALQTSGKYVSRIFYGLLFFAVCALVLPFLSWIIFVLLPRSQNAQWDQSNSTTSGFSTEVNLAGDGKIYTNPAPVFRVNGDVPAYFRGMTYSLFDGIKWLKGVKLPRKLSKGVSQSEISFLSLYQLTAAQEQSKKSCQVTFVNHDFRILFSPHNLLGLTFDEPALYQDQDLILHIPRSQNRLKDHYGFLFLPENGYRGHSVKRARSSRLQWFYLHAPSGMNPKILDLAKKITAHLPKPEDKIRALMDYLNENYYYTLDLPPATLDPLSNFLFTTKKGHCEYFATAMTILARLSGVPARMVNGFHGSDYNSPGGFAIVRQSHAHAWAEVLLPGKGWVVADPSPMERIVQLRENSVKWKFFGHFFDYLNIVWIENFVNFSSFDQWAKSRDLSLDLFSNGKMASELTENRGLSSEWFSAFLALVVVLTGAIWVIFRKKSVDRSVVREFFGGKVDVSGVKPGLLQFLKEFKKIGYEKKPHQSIRCFLQGTPLWVNPILRESFTRVIDKTERECYSTYGTKTGEDDSLFQETIILVYEVFDNADKGLR